MSKTVAQHQADYRARRTEKLARMETALKTIVNELGESTKPPAMKIADIARTGLGLVTEGKSQ